jgi:hypothetical protein
MMISCVSDLRLEAASSSPSPRQPLALDREAGGAGVDLGQIDRRQRQIGRAKVLLHSSQLARAGDGHNPGRWASSQASDLRGRRTAPLDDTLRRLAPRW